jgi:hypothetical protein
MPAAPDHYRFALARLCAEGPAASRPGLVLLGTQGPDPFFFRGLVPTRHRRGAARSVAFAEFAQHADPESLFGPIAAASAASRDAEGAFRFLYGLLLHYALDSALHRYVFSRSGFDPEGKLSGRYAADHARFETGIAESFGIESLPANDLQADTRPRSMLASGPAELGLADEVLAAAFPGRVEPGEYGEAWADMFTVLEVLWDPRGAKRLLLDAVGLGRSHARAMMRPGLPDPELDYLNLKREAWPDPADGRQSRESVPELIGAAGLVADRALALVEAIRAGVDPRIGWEALAGGVTHEGIASL